MPEPVGCEAVTNKGTGLRDCGEGVYALARYHRLCECWPLVMGFCHGHAPLIFAEWMPPQQRGECPHCQGPLTLRAMEVLPLKVAVT